MKNFSRFGHLLILMFLLIFFACEEDNKLEKEISEIPVDFQIERFDEAFSKASINELPKLREQYPFILVDRIPDSLYIMEQQDSLQLVLFKEVAKKYPNLTEVEHDIKRLFQHLKYYDKTFSIPRVITATSSVDYRNKTIVTDSIVLIALDTYLGSEHEFYGNIPMYTTQNMETEQIVSDLAGDYAEKYTYQSQKKTFLDEMIFFGKQLYFKDKVIPFETEAIRMGYNGEQLGWAMANEYQIWTYFIENELLYSTDSSLPSRFIAPAPFSKFYLELDNEAPGRLGQYIGWQIVKSYMNNNDTPFLKMMELEADEIFKNSKYKPNK
ncbi:protein involved in gliding motility GldB [Flavobacteriaceae bacterium MAR_2010_188]|nr:protein involved in gliding motility GldB [Flavobacteriaceae bacterium MAR_2010_188]